MKLYFENIIYDLQNANDNEEILLILLKCLKLQKKWIEDSHLNYKFLHELSKHLNKDQKIFSFILRVQKHLEFLYPRWISADQKSARDFTIKIFNSTQSSDEEKCQALFLLHKIIRPVDNILLRAFFSNTNPRVKSLAFNCYLEVTAIEDIPFLFKELFNPSPMIIKVFHTIIENYGREAFFDFFIEQAQNSDINKKLKLFEICKKLQTSQELVQILKIFTKIPIREVKLLLLDVLSFHTGTQIDSMIDIYLNDFDIDICEKAQKIKNNQINKRSKKFPF
ncbi:MAG: hypothetical protein COB02_01405 [Candidatus Cloacimonadota bacterium]|nr:MAG: hypothetical protein COB02_01405 [Candidatus Cloacimonadota bacterium]